MTWAQHPESTLFENACYWCTHWGNRGSSSGLAGQPPWLLFISKELFSCCSIQPMNSAPRLFRERTDTLSDKRIEKMSSPIRYEETRFLFNLIMHSSYILKCTFNFSMGKMSQLSFSLRILAGGVTYGTCSLKRYFIGIWSSSGHC